MKKIYYKKAQSNNNKSIIRFIGTGLILSGAMIVFYIFYPILSWQLFDAPIFAAQTIISPLPHSTNIAFASVQNIKSQVLADTNTVDYTKAQNWFPPHESSSNNPINRSVFYTISIPKINVKNALVSTKDNDLSLHMVNFDGTAVPPDRGTSVIFGHSTLPQLYDPTNYKTILANAYTLRVGDSILVNTTGSTYTYKIYSTTVVSPDDISVFDQQTDASYLVLVTCTPPGTILYRLVIRAKLEQL